MQRVGVETDVYAPEMTRSLVCSSRKGWLWFERQDGLDDVELGVEVPGFHLSAETLFSVSPHRS